MKYFKNPEAVEAMSFEEFVAYAKETTPEPHWAVQWKGVNISHENDQQYLFIGHQGSEIFNVGDVIVEVMPGILTAMPEAEFKEKYSKA